MSARARHSPHRRRRLSARRAGDARRGRGQDRAMGCRGCGRRRRVARLSRVRRDGAGGAGRRSWCARASRLRWKRYRVALRSHRRRTRRTRSTLQGPHPGRQRAEARGTTDAIAIPHASSRLAAKSARRTNSSARRSSTTGASCRATSQRFRDDRLAASASPICYDSEFPLLVRSMVEAGADIILVPACTEFVSGYHRVRTAAIARALEGTCVDAWSRRPSAPPRGRRRSTTTTARPASTCRQRTACRIPASSRKARSMRRAGSTPRSISLPWHASPTRGEMRNRADWRLQPGGDLALPTAAVVPLL